MTTDRRTVDSPEAPAAVGPCSDALQVTGLRRGPRVELDAFGTR
jgi:hypothetical protein